MVNLIPWAAGLALVGAVALGLYMAITSNPEWVYGIGKGLVKDIIKAMLPGIAPKDYTPEQLAKMRAGGEAGLPGQKPQHDDFPRIPQNKSKPHLTLVPKKRTNWIREK